MQNNNNNNNNKNTCDLIRERKNSKMKTCQVI
jgi:hypothetical protein